MVVVVRQGRQADSWCRRGGGDMGVNGRKSVRDIVLPENGVKTDQRVHEVVAGTKLQQARVSAPGALRLAHHTTTNNTAGSERE